MSSPANARLQEEASYFDHVAEQLAHCRAPIPPATVRRYSDLKRPHLHPEYRFLAAGPLAGKRVLDVGCGIGDTSLILAALGAQVTGLDLSERSIELARDRAELNGLADRTRFVAAPIQEAGFDAEFDIIWCDAFLHHVLDDFDHALALIRSWAAPGARVIITEPVNLSPRLRSFRLAFFPERDHTPGERPLELAEVERLRAEFTDVSVRYFHGLGRLGRLVLPDQQFETASATRRWLYDALHRLDWALLSPRSTQWLAGIMVLSGRVPGPRAVVG